MGSLPPFQSGIPFWRISTDDVDLEIRENSPRLALALGPVGSLGTGTL